MRSLIAKFVMLLATLPALALADVGAVVEGVEIDDSATVAGSKLVLNGAGFRKRGFFKTSVEAIYLPEKKQSLEAITRMPGPKRLAIYVLKDIPGSTISRYFVNDFKLVATDNEFKQLINEIGTIGAVYGSLPKVTRGDTIFIDWVPGKGIACFYNGKPMLVENQTSAYLNSPNADLMYKIFLRIYMGPAVAEELRLNLLGQSRSMNTATIAAER